MMSRGKYMRGISCAPGLSCISDMMTSNTLLWPWKALPDIWAMLVMFDRESKMEYF
jgi:hypothetical protein